MKIRLSDIPKTGLPVTETLPRQILNERISGGSDHGIVFTEDLHVNLIVTKSTSGAETKGSVTSRYLQPCSRCAEGLERALELKTNYILQPRPEVIKGNEEEQYEDDVGITYYDGEHIDLDDLIQETIILSLSLYWHPGEDREGKCTHCHQQVVNITPKKVEATKGTKLSDLLNKAGVK
jgi:uncharacterized metal-binding protein YceD (DUF177 family)